MVVPPLAIPMLAAVTPREHEIIMIDENYQKINFDEKCDIVGISVLTKTAIRSYQIAKIFREKKVPVILGGLHPSILPEEAKQHADSVVIGEAEEIWPKLLMDFEIGKLKPFYRQTEPVDLKKIPSPRRDIIKRSFIASPVQSSRGCPYGCKFCSLTNSVHGKIHRTRPIECVVNEIKNINQKLLNFFDPSLTINVEYTKTLFKALKGMNKKFFCLGNVDVLCKDDELLMLAKEAGCIQWHIGFESISQHSLEKIGKKTNTVENYLKTVKKIHRYGMNVHGFFIFGLDGDKKDVFDETLKFIMESKLDSVDLNTFIPFPGTPLYEELSKQGRILTKDWSKYRFQKNIVFTPKNFSELELHEGIIKIFKNYYSFKNIIKRFLNIVHRDFSFINLTLFVIENVISRYYFLKLIKKS